MGSDICACGFFLERGLTWQKARDGCRKQNGRLPEINNDQENAAIYQFFASSFIYLFTLKYYISFKSLGTLTISNNR